MFRLITAKFFVIFFVAVILFSSVPVTGFTAPVTVGFIASGVVIDDDSFNGMTLSGLRRLQLEKGVKVEVRSGGFNCDSFEKQFNSLVEQGIKIVVINSSSYHDKILKFIEEHSDAYFIVIDDKIEGYPNVSSIEFGQSMGACLVGALCAWQSKTGKVGFIGGNEQPVIKDFLCGFKKGIGLAGENVKVEVKFIRSGISDKGFEDPQQANIIAKRMYASGADIIFAVAGLSGNGIIHAARESGNFVVGVYSDQDYMAKGTILTSMMKRLDVAVYKEVLSILEGRFVPGKKVYDLSNSGVGLTEMEYSRHLIPNDVFNRIETLREALATGEIQLNCSAK